MYAGASDVCHSPFSSTENISPCVSNETTQEIMRSVLSCPERDRASIKQASCFDDTHTCTTHVYCTFYCFMCTCSQPYPLSLQCCLELAQYSTLLYTTELDSLSNACLRAMDGSSYNVRCSVAQLLGSLMALTQRPVTKEMRGRLKLPSLDEVLGILANGFVRGGGGFLKGGGPELLKTGSASRETRVGVTQVCE